MKLLAALLVVLNVGAFIWGGWYKDAPEEIRRPRPALQADKMRLLSEPGVTRVPRTPLPPVRPTPAAMEEAAATATSGGCFAIGPFPTPMAAVKAGAQLDRLRLAYAVRSERQRVPSAWQVLLPPLSSMAKAEAKRKELTRQGITDHFLILEGTNRRGISLGVFSTPEAAQKQSARLAQQGLTAQIQTLYRHNARFWLDGPLPVAQTWTAVEGLQWGGPDVHASQGPCLAPAAEGRAVQAPALPAS